MSLVVWTSLSVSPSKCSAALFNLSKIREVSTSAAAIFSPLRTSSSVLQADHHGLQADCHTCAREFLRPSGCAEVGPAPAQYRWVWVHQRQWAYWLRTSNGSGRR